jgi:sarcosine/dimethylglycine N-methyltransferase
VAGNRRVPNTPDLEEGCLMAGLEAHYSAGDIEARILAAVRAAGLNPEQRLLPRELGALDHFHTGGVRASRELLALAQIRAEDRVLDIGAGLAGPARLLASVLGCRVDCLEMSPDFCAAAVLLNRLTGLDERIKVHQGNALGLPFPDDSFDVVWMQNVGMNIADKQKLYGEIRRVLKPGGRYAFQEMALAKRRRPIFRFRGPPTRPTASWSRPKRCAGCSASSGLSLNSSRIPAKPT